MNGRHESPRVSVIIPTFNRAWCLREAIDSVLAQDFTDFELIVVDDGSTDGTGALLSGFSGRLTVLSQPNRGVSAARNAGIAAARAGLIAFLDSDDLWLPRKLTTQVGWFRQRPRALICQTEELWLRNGRRVNPGRRHRKRGGMIFEPSLELCLVSPSAVMVRRALFDRVGLFDEALPACEDYDLWLRVSARFAVGLIETPLIVKRGGHPDQLSRAFGLDRHRIASLFKLLEGGRLTPGQRQAAAGVLRRKCAIYAAGCRKRGRIEEAEYYVSLAGEYLNSSLIPGRQALRELKIEKRSRAQN
jgi:glycosyltransferase involved in cell wall biosynthesis